MAQPRRSLLVLVLALGLVGLAGPGTVAGAEVGVAAVPTDVTTPTLTATEEVENTTDSVADTPPPTSTDSELLDTVDDDATDAESTLSGAVDETVDTADGLLYDTASDLATGASLDGSLAAAPAPNDRSPEIDNPPMSSQTDRARATTTAAGPPGQRGSPTAPDPVSPLAGGALVGGAAVLTGLAGRTMVAGSDSLAVGASGSWVRDAALGPGVDWRDRLRPLLGLFGYQRFDDSDPLEHAGRKRLYERIRAEPGVHLTAVSESADLPLSTARYHLRILEHEGLVRGVKRSGKRRYFPPDVENEALVAALSDGPTGRVLRSLVHEGPASVSRLAGRLDRDPSTVSHHLERLATDRLVERERQGQAVVSTAAPEVRAAVEQLDAHDHPVARAKPAASSD